MAGKVETIGDLKKQAEALGVLDGESSVSDEVRLQIIQTNLAGTENTVEDAKVKVRGWLLVEDANNLKPAIEWLEKVMKLRDHMKQECDSALKAIAQKKLKKETVKK